jgi:hypothetical protein
LGKYPDYKPDPNQKTKQFVSVQRRSEFPDGSVAQINILPIPTRKTKGAQVGKDELDEREKLIKEIIIESAKDGGSNDYVSGCV